MKLHLKWMISFILCFLPHVVFSSLKGPQDLPEEYLPVVSVVRESRLNMAECEVGFEEKDISKKQAWTQGVFDEKGYTLLTSRDFLSFDLEGYIHKHRDILTQKSIAALRNDSREPYWLYFSSFWNEPYLSVSIIGGDVCDPSGSYGIIFRPDPALMLQAYTQDATTLLSTHWTSERQEVSPYGNNINEYFSSFSGTVLGLVRETLHTPQEIIEKTRTKVIYGHNEAVFATQSGGRYLEISGFWYRGPGDSAYASTHWCHKAEASEEDIQRLKKIGKDLKLPIMSLSDLVSESDIKLHSVLGEGVANPFPL